MRVHLALLVVVAGCKTVTPPEPRSSAVRQPCDPGGSSFFFTPDGGACAGPRAEDCAGHCGDGTRQWMRCETRSWFTCEHGAGSETSCHETTELCDGEDVGGATCESLGFRGGVLRCGSRCNEFDTRACDACPSTKGVLCFQVAGVDQTIQAFAPIANDGVVTAIVDPNDEARLAWYRRGRPVRVVPWPHGDVIDLVEATGGLFVLSMSENGPELFLVGATGAPARIALPEAQRSGCAHLVTAFDGAPVIVSDPSCGGPHRAAMVNRALQIVPLPREQLVRLSPREDGEVARVAVRTDQGSAVVALFERGEGCVLEAYVEREAASHPVPLDEARSIELGAGTFRSSGKGCSGLWEMKGRAITLEPMRPPPIPETWQDRRLRSAKGRWAGVEGQTLILFPPP